MSPPSRGLRGPPGLGPPASRSASRLRPLTWSPETPAPPGSPRRWGRVRRSGPGRSGPNGLYTGRWAGRPDTRSALQVPFGPVRVCGTRDEGMKAGPGGGRCCDFPQAPPPPARWEPRVRRAGSWVRALVPAAPPGGGGAGVGAGGCDEFY